MVLAMLALAAACAAASAPRVPTGGSRVLKYTVITSGRPSGDGELRIEPDGTRRTHFAFNDRGRGPDVMTEQRLDGAGAPRYFRATGHFSRRISRACAWTVAPSAQALDVADASQISATRTLRLGVCRSPRRSAQRDVAARRVAVAPPVELVAPEPSGRLVRWWLPWC
jgi:hypothetical protein